MGQKTSKALAARQAEANDANVVGSGVSSSKAPTDKVALPPPMESEPVPPTIPAAAKQRSIKAAPPVTFPAPPKQPNIKDPSSSANADPSQAAAAQPTPVRKLRTDARVKDVYRLGKTLGTGGFAVVKLAVDKATEAEYACKIMALPQPGETPGENENTREDIFKEIDILCSLNHDNVVFLKEYFEDGNKVYLITELLTGGELLDAVLQRGHYTEDEARVAFVQLIKGIEYLHSRNVVHRDLKLENLLLAKPGDITCIKIADFGLAKQVVESMSTVCGTPQYVAPEVIQGTPGLVYGPGVDMWSAGVVLYILLGGYPPFWSDSEPALFEQIRRGAFNFDDAVWTCVSETAKDLIRKLLVVDPAKRLTAAQSLKHEWVAAGPATEPVAA